MCMPSCSHGIMVGLICYLFVFAMGFFGINNVGLLVVLLFCCFIVVVVVAVRVWLFLLVYPEFSRT